METETRVQPEMPVPGQSIESNEQKAKRGGKRPGAGRKLNPVKIKILIGGIIAGALIYVLGEMNTLRLECRVQELQRTFISHRRLICPGLSSYEKEFPQRFKTSPALED